MEGFEGLEPVTNEVLIKHVQEKAQNYCGWKLGGFPGSAPVPMDRDNMKFLAENPYMISHKADGKRYLMLIEGKDRIYLINRNNSVFLVSNLTFLNNEGRHVYDILLDGELLNVKKTINGQIKEEICQKYLIFDIILIQGEKIWMKDLKTRINCIKNEILGPRENNIKRGQIDVSNEPFEITLNLFRPLKEAKNMMQDVSKGLFDYEMDGFMFSPCLDPYTIGRADNILKWKPPHLNTIDFILKIVAKNCAERIGELYVTELSGSSNIVLLATMKIDGHLEKYNNKIIECKLVENEWTFFRERTDKSFPNNLHTAKSVLKSIEDCIKEEELLEFIDKSHKI